METINLATKTPKHSMMVGGNAIIEDVTSTGVSKENLEDYFRRGIIA